MIQRIQTVYLVLGILSLIILFLLDTIWTSPADELLAWFSPALLVLGGLGVLAAGVSIFLYKNRKQQRKIVVTAQMIVVLFMVVLYGGLYLAADLTIIENQVIDGSRVVVLLLPVLAYVFFYLARKGIDRDINLIRSMDRLR